MKKESWERTLRSRISAVWARRGWSRSGSVGGGAEVESLRFVKSRFLLKRKCSNKGLKPLKRKGKEMGITVLN